MSGHKLVCSVIGCLLAALVMLVCCLNVQSIEISNEKMQVYNTEQVTENAEDDSMALLLQMLNN